MIDLSGKVALVTGGRSGIGAASAEALAAAGARVLTAQRRADPRFQCFEVDFADKAALARLIDQVIDATGRLDILVNNAGLMREGTVLESSLEDWEATL